MIAQDGLTISDMRNVDYWVLERRITTRMGVQDLNDRALWVVFSLSPWAENGQKQPLESGSRLDCADESAAIGEKRRHVGALTLSSDFDHHLSKCSPREMLVSFACFLERIHLIDHGTDLVFVEKSVHPVE